MVKNSELGFYAVYNPDQVMPHYVLEVNSSGLPRNVDALLNHPVCAKIDLAFESFA